MDDRSEKRERESSSYPAGGAMKLRTRVLIGTLSASLILIAVLGLVFFISGVGIRNMVIKNANTLGDSSAEIGAYIMEAQLSEKIERIARDTALLLGERFGDIENQPRMSGSAFARIIDSVWTDEIGRLFILNRDGVNIYSSLSEGEGGANTGENFLESSNPGKRSLGLSMTLGASGLTRLKMDGISVYVAYAPIQTSGWSLGIAVPVQEVSASARLIENQIWKITDDTTAGIDRHILFTAAIIGGLLVLTLIGIAVFALRFSSAITGPILALNDGVQDVSAGNLEREVIIQTGDELEQFADSFNMMTVRLRNYIEEIARVTAERQRIDTELDIARHIQRDMLPDIFPPDFDLYAEVHPAREVGGDFYDFFFIDDNHFAIIIADVSGKGIPAALFMAMTSTLIRSRLHSGEDPAAALEIINRQLCGNNDAGMFVTAWLGVLEVATGKLAYINAGHNQPLLGRKGGGFTFLVSPPDLVLAGLDDTRYRCRELQLGGGDTLFLYTDGIVEAADTAGALYGKERLRNFLNGHAQRPFPELFTALRADTAAFSNGAEQSDDMTMLAIRIRGGQHSPRSLTLRAGLSELDALTSFIAGNLDAGGCPQEIRRQIELAAEEVFVNIARYAYSEPDFGEMTVDCRVEPASEAGGMTITLIFSDRGCPFNPLEAAEPDTNLPLEKCEPGGLGLLIVRKTMDTIHYSRDNGLNRLEFSKSWYNKG